MSTLVKIEADKNPVAVTGTWDGVRHWLNAGKLFEQGKLFSQVMVGFELLALQKARGIENGSKAHLSHDGKGQDWETILQNEAGLAQSTAYRYMDMAKLAAPRLKKLPALKDFNPFEVPLAKLAEPQREALTSAVKKLTDGKSQADFFEELYKQAGKATGREPGCDNSRDKLSLSQEAELRRTKAAADWAALAKLAAAYQDKFVLLTDADVEAQMATLEQALIARKAWLKQPVNHRQPRLIAEMFQSRKA